MPPTTTALFCAPLPLALANLRPQPRPPATPRLPAPAASRTRRAARARLGDPSAADHGHDFNHADAHHTHAHAHAQDAVSGAIASAARMATKLVNATLDNALAELAAPPTQDLDGSCALRSLVTAVLSARILGVPRHTLKAHLLLAPPNPTPTAATYSYSTPRARAGAPHFKPPNGSGPTARASSSSSSSSSSSPLSATATNGANQNHTTAHTNAKTNNGANAGEKKNGSHTATRKPSTRNIDACPDALPALSPRRVHANAMLLVDAVFDADAFFEAPSAARRRAARGWGDARGVAAYDGVWRAFVRGGVAGVARRAFAERAWRGAASGAVSDWAMGREMECESESERLAGEGATAPVLLRGGGAHVDVVTAMLIEVRGLANADEAPL